MLPALPADFSGRLRAARAYLDKTREEFAALLNVPGASSANLKAYEGGERNPPALAAPGLVARLADVTGLPEAFFWGDGITPDDGTVEKRLHRIEQQLRLLRAEQAADRTKALRPTGASWSDRGRRAQGQ